MHKGKTLISELEKQQIEKIQSERPFTIPHVQTGDVVEVYKFQSLSSGKLQEYRGVVIASQKLNRIGGSITVLGTKGNQQYTVEVQLYSPLIAKINILKYGSNNLRMKQLHFARKGLSKGQIMSPILKGKGRVGKVSREKFQRQRYLLKLKKKGVDIQPILQKEREQKREENQKMDKRKLRVLEQKKSILDDLSLQSIEEEKANK